MPLLKHGSSIHEGVSDNFNADLTINVAKNCSPDVKEGKHGLKLKVDLPGIDKKDVSISMENGMLSIQGEREEEKKEEGDNYYRVERVSGKFYRRFALPETADAEKIQANMTKGVLEVTIPKKEVAKPKSIEIKGEK